MAKYNLLEFNKQYYVLLANAELFYFHVLSIIHKVVHNIKDKSQK